MTNCYDNIVYFEGEDKTLYAFKEFLFDPLPTIENCVYIYARQEADTFVPVYIGMTTRSFAVRYKEHDKDDVNYCCGFNHGNSLFIYVATHAFQALSEMELQHIERNLISKYRPACNKT